MCHLYQFPKDKFDIGSCKFHTRLKHKIDSLKSLVLSMCHKSYRMGKSKEDHLSQKLLFQNKALKEFQYFQREIFSITWRKYMRARTVNLNFIHVGKDSSYSNLIGCRN